VFLSAFANANFPPHHQNACYSNKKSVVTKNQWTASPWQPKCNGHGPLSTWFSSRVTSTHLHRLHTSPLLHWSASCLWEAAYCCGLDVLGGQPSSSVSILSSYISRPIYRGVRGGGFISEPRVAFQKSTFTKILGALDFLVTFVFGSPLYLDTTPFSIFFSEHVYGTQQIWVSIVFPTSNFGSTSVLSTHWFSKLTIGTPRFSVHIKLRMRQDFWSSLNFGTPHISLAPVRQHISYPVHFCCAILCPHCCVTLALPPPDGFLSGRLSCERARQV